MEEGGNCQNVLLEFAPLFVEVQRRLTKRGFLPASADSMAWNSVFNEFLRFLSCKDLGTDGGLPPRLDEVWHECILNTRLYTAMCIKLRGCYIHHTTVSEQHDPTEIASRVDRTVHAYRKRYREEPDARVLVDEEEEDDHQPKPKVVIASAIGSDSGRLAELRARQQQLILLCRTPPSYQVHVKTLNGQTITVETNGTMTIAQLKQAITRKDPYSTPADQQRLIFAGRNLDDGRTCADYNLMQDCTIHLVKRLSGC